MENGSAVRLGELLVRKRHLKEEDLQRALAIQQQEKELQGRPVGEILAGKGLFSHHDIKNLLGHPPIREEIAAIAVGEGLITKEQLESCLAKKRPDQLMGDLLIDEGLLNPDEVGRFFREQIQTRRVADLAVKLKLISPRDLKNALKIQRAPRLLGEILCDLKLIDPLDLNHILQKHGKQLKLGQILLDLGYVTTKQLNAAREEERHSNDSLAKIMLRKNHVTQAQLNVALEKLWNIPFKDLSSFTYSENQKRALVNLVSQKYAERNLVLPISVRKGKLTLATYNPESIRVLHDLKKMYQTMNIACILVTQEKFEELYEILYSRRLGEIESDNKEGLLRQDGGLDLIELDFDENLEGMNKERPIYDIQDIEIQELVNFVLKYGIINGASDIHIEQDRENVGLRFRIDGILRSTNIGWLNQKIRENVSAVISRIKIMSNLDIAEKRLPQDGVFRINICERERGQRIDIDCRVSTCRAIVGENLTVRILDPRKAQLGLEQLNHSPHVLEPLKTLLKSSEGLLLVTGPTGSGKSSTLYGAMRYLYHPGIKIITAEDPIEYSFPGIMQTQVKPKIDLTFSRLLRSFLRLDPDVILVGEIRDEETAKIALDAAQTGHLILSTLHTNDSISSVSRLLDLGVDYGQMASSLRCALAQRLVRRICSSCVEQYAPEEDEWGPLFFRYPSHLTFYRGQGCETCNFTGYKGRTVLSEIFMVDSDMVRAMNTEMGEDQLRKMALEAGMKSMVEDGLLKMDETTLSEIIRVTPHKMMRAFRSENRTPQAGSLPTDADSDHDRSPKGDLPVASPFYIKDPAADGEIIDLMYKQYKSLMTEIKDDSCRLDAALFKEFVTNSYQRISQNHGCTGVTFDLSMNQERLEISAVPVHGPQPHERTS